MTLALTCSRCQQEITGADEDDLVTRVQDHVAGHGRDHGHSHQISRDQVLQRLRRPASIATATAGPAPAGGGGPGGGRRPGG